MDANEVTLKIQSILKGCPPEERKPPVILLGLGDQVSVWHLGKSAPRSRGLGLE